jgi:DNA polymerase
MASIENTGGAQAFVPAALSLSAMRSAVQGCRGCPLYAHATQAVFGEGRKAARLMLVGEQPGNEEDLQGLPFVGPAGKVLERALEDAGIARDSVYVTNAVKHFKFEERGKRRIHKKPSAGEIEACRPWLHAELKIVHPDVLVAMGATAARSIFGPGFALLKNRGKIFDHEWAKAAVATIHPSAILRMPDSDRRHAEFAGFVADLKAIRQRLH